MRARHRKGRPVLATLPVLVTFFLCAVTLHALFFELVPAARDHRLARAALRHQVEVLDATVADRDRKALECSSLANDPQAIERALDEKGLLPEAPRGER